jgi:asparagine synthase (glutamine-hydrolysing)
MCGILGVVGRPIDSERLIHMTDSMIHRGPDAAGFFPWDQGAFAHRRLSILDTSAAANQPFLDPQRRALLVFNGEIYNFLDLRRQLESRGHVFRTTSDTEVLLASYLEWGDQCVGRFNGMFAFAVWDFRRRRLLLARDRFGKKPLYWTRFADGSVLFASELKPFLASGWIDPSPCPEALVDYLQLNYVLAPKTLLRQVQQLPPAHTACWHAGQWQEARFWDLADNLQAPRLTDRGEQLVERLEELLLDATRQRRHSDVPLGAFLSGGVDSSTIVALTRRASAETLHTFSVEFAAPSFNEGTYSRLAARHLGTEHHPWLVQEDLSQLLPDFARRMDVPVGDDSAISTFLLSRWARQQVTVALSGDGADELFAGYVTHQADSLHRALGGFRKPAAWLLHRLIPAFPDRGAKLSRRFRLEQMARGLRLDEVGAHFAWRQVARPEPWCAALLRQAAPDYDPAETFREYARRVPEADWLDRLLYVDCQTWLPDDILVKIDRATMAASLECRSPFLDYRVAEFAARLPRSCKLRHLQTKVILKRLARRHLPAALVNRRKAGFNSPTADWLRGPMRPLAEDIFRSRELEDLGVRWSGALAGRWQAFLGGDRRPQYSFWGLFCLGLWQRHVLRAVRSCAPGAATPQEHGLSMPPWRRQAV